MGSPTDLGQEDSPMEVGHNIYILAYQLGQHKKELEQALEKVEKANRTSDPIFQYSRSTAHIEVRFFFCFVFLEGEGGLLLVWAGRANCC